MTAPRIAVVVPAFGQPEYLGQAILSALDQTVSEQVRIVVVNDGCAFESTDAVARFFASSQPAVRYLKTPNRGLSAARNTGTRFALDAWPSVEAIFPLDADNMLAPQTLAKLVAALDRHPAAGWVYQDLQYFGLERGVVVQPRTFSLYRLLLGNFCDAGSLIRRSVFEQGVWFDESMRSGFEDWDFFLRAALDGFTGVHCADTGFLYRRRGHSMLSAAAGNGPAFAAVVRSRPEARHPTRLAVLEHMEMPRYAVFDVDRDRVQYQTLDLEEADPLRDLETLARDIALGWGEGPAAPGYVPPLVAVTTSTFRRFLQRQRLWAGMLFRLQQRCAATRRPVGVAVEYTGNSGVTWEAGDSAGPFALVMVPTRTLFAAATEGDLAALDTCGSGLATITCDLRPPALRIDFAAVTQSLITGIAGTPQSAGRLRGIDELGANNSVRSDELHVGPVRTFLPTPPGSTPRSRYLVSAAHDADRARAIIDAGGVSGADGPVTLVLTGKLATLDLADSSVSGAILLHDGPHLEAILQQVLEGADDIVTLDRTLPNDVFMRLQATRPRRLTFVLTSDVYLHTDSSRAFAEAARAREAQYDAFIVPTARAMRMALNWGVPREKLAVQAFPEPAAVEVHARRVANLQVPQRDRPIPALPGP